MTDSVPGTRLRNAAIALAAALLAAALFLGLRVRSPEASLDSLAASSVPLDAALASDRPTLVEFYANWCASCQAMAGDLKELREEYGDRANFSMLNVDNTKWLPEILSYGVDGIPHFVFLGADGRELGQAIGEQPPSVMAANLEALVAGEPLPYATALGQTSEFAAPGAAAPDSRAKTDPRSHGGQVVAPAAPNTADS